MNEKERVGNITINGARIIFRNFAGKEGKFNSAGKRNFCVLLDKDLASQLARDGWNVKQLQPKDNYTEPQDYLQVSVNYDGSIQPKIWLVAGESKTLLDGESVASLDYAEISNVDLIIRPYQWEVSGKFGIKAYVKSMFVTIAEDELEKRYRDIPESVEDDELPFK